MDEFSISSIAELGRTITGKTPSSSDPEDFGGETPFVTPSDSFDHKYIEKTERGLSAEGVRKLKGKLLSPDSVLVTCIGSAMGKVAMNKVACITNQQINSIVLHEKYSPHYVCYALKNSYKQLRHAATGSTALPLLSKGDFDLLTIRIHNDKSTQHRIAAVLSALDARIDLNHRINAELEALAKTIYDYWFVQFDFPDAHGRPYKSSGGRMVWNDTLKREIPARWEAGQLSDIANITMGQSPAGDSYNEEGRGAVFFQGSTDFGLRSPEVRMFTTSPGRMAREGDILVSVRAPVGTLNIADRDCCIGRGLAALNSKADSAGYLYRVMADFKQVFDRRSSEGTTFGSITKDGLFGLKVLIPEARILQAHARIANDWIRLATLRDRESRELTRVRDWLLPLLMNGQVRVA